MEKGLLNFALFSLMFSIPALIAGVGIIMDYGPDSYGIALASFGGLFAVIACTILTMELINKKK